jgi:hypothetical protein
MNWAALIAAIATVETGGHPSPDTAMGDGGTSAGRYQISRACIEDVNEAYHTRYTWPDDACDPAMAARICAYYLEYWCAAYEKRHHAKATPDIAARIWNGGPQGWAKPATARYWERVKAAMRNQ